MTDEEVGAIWRDECAKADHITWAATAFARRIEAVERERCATICDAEGAEWDSDAQQALKNYAAHCASLIRGA